MKTHNNLYFVLITGMVWLLAACSAPEMDNSPAAESVEPIAVGASGIPTETATTEDAPQSAPVAEAITSSTARVPFEEALDDLHPTDVFKNFYSITQVPRPSGEMEQIRDFLVTFGKGLGLETIVDEAGNVIIRKPASAGFENREGVILQAHMDMVPQKSEDKAFDFAADPIEAFVDGDFIVTDGTTLGADDGIGIAMIMTALQSETLRTGPIEGLFTVDEETDMSGINGLAAGVLQGTTLINLDSEEEGMFTIGSAGGERAEVHTTYTEVPVPADMVSYEVAVEGLKGGHSGVDINLGRGHATKILVRLLKESAQLYGLRVASISGGTAGNAIPRDAEAVVYIAGSQVEPFLRFVEEFEAKVRSELQAVEPDLRVEISEADAPQQVMEESFQATLINALYGGPQGVLRMSDAVPGLVETSTNMGIINAVDGQLEVIYYLRSSVDSALDDVGQMIASVWELAGIPVEFSDAYGGWTPDPDSPVLALMQEVYEDLYGQEPTISAVHAGLECGVVTGTYPDMDMISVGPTIENVHSPSERLHIPSVAKVMDLLTATLEQMPELEG
jgi:dipeptidase D